MNIIDDKGNVFLLNTKETSYLFRVDRYGHLEHIHYGSKVRTEDAEALSLKHKILFGSTVMYHEKDDIMTLDSVPQEYGSYGQGDFKEASIEIEGNGSYTCDFRYVSHEIREGKYALRGLPALSDALHRQHLRGVVGEVYVSVPFLRYGVDGLDVRHVELRVP